MPIKLNKVVSQTLKRIQWLVQITSFLLVLQLQPAFRAAVIRSTVLKLIWLHVKLFRHKKSNMVWIVGESYRKVIRINKVWVVQFCTCVGSEDREETSGRSYQFPGKIGKDLCIQQVLLLQILMVWYIYAVLLMVVPYGGQRSHDMHKQHIHKIFVVAEL